MLEWARLLELLEYHYVLTQRAAEAFDAGMGLIA